MDAAYAALEKELAELRAWKLSVEQRLWVLARYDAMIDVAVGGTGADPTRIEHMTTLEGPSIDMAIMHRKGGAIQIVNGAGQAALELTEVSRIPFPKPAVLPPPAKNDPPPIGKEKK